MECTDENIQNEEMYVHDDNAKKDGMYSYDENNEKRRQQQRAGPLTNPRISLHFLKFKWEGRENLSKI